MLTGDSHRRRAPARHGFTLAELLVVVVLMGIIGAAVVQVLVRQQRFYNGATQVMRTRDDVRELASFLPSDLRSLSAAGGDIYEMTDSSIRFRRGSGQSAICTIGALRTSVTIPPTTLASNAGITAWPAMPVVGDSMFVLDEGALPSSTDDSWHRAAVTAAPATAQTCPMTSGLTTTAAEAATGMLLTFTPALPATVVIGAPIRFFRPARYSLYDAGGGRWMLGYEECPGAVCAAREPIAGPFLAYDPVAGSGVTFTYFDSTGAVAATPANVARILLSVHAQTASALDLNGGQPRHIRDSLDVDIALRNRQ